VKDCDLVIHNGALIGSSNCNLVQFKKLLPNKQKQKYLSFIDLSDNGAIYKTFKFRKIDLAKTYAKTPQPSIKIISSFKYRLIIPGFQHFKHLPPHPLTAHLRELSFDVDVHSSEAFDRRAINQFSKKSKISKNVLIVKFLKYSQHNNIKIIFFKGNNPQDERTHYLWVEWQENDRITFYNPKTKKYLQTRIVNYGGITGQNLSQYGYDFKIGFYLCKESNSIVVYEGNMKTSVEHFVDVFEDDMLNEIDNVAYHKLDTYGVNMNEFKTLKGDSHKFENYAKFKITLKNGKQIFSLNILKMESL
jgi:hypothetical protein